jgi:TolA-binding protein
MMVPISVQMAPEADRGAARIRYSAAAVGILVIALLLVFGKIHKSQPVSESTISVVMRPASHPAPRVLTTPAEAVSPGEVAALMQINAQLGVMNSQIGSLNKKVESVRTDLTARADRTDGKIADLSHRVDGVSARLGADEARIAEIETRMSPMMAAQHASVDQAPAEPHHTRLHHRH